MLRHHVERHRDRAVETVEHHAEGIADQQQVDMRSSMRAIGAVYAVRQTIGSWPLRATRSGTETRADLAPPISPGFG